MYKVLLADDERIIRDGISSIIKWQELNLSLIGAAKNGIEAYELIKEHQPDIVITDIRMPGLDGLQLIEKTREGYPTIKFIVLSGYNEFEYAREAMKYGVKHYLLKPTDDQKLSQVLCEVIEELHSYRKKEAYIKNMKYNMKKITPHLKQQFLREYITDLTYGRSEWEYFMKGLFKILDYKGYGRIIVFKIDEQYNYEFIFVLNNIATEILHNHLILNTNIKEKVVLLIKDIPVEELYKSLEKIKEVFYDFYQMYITISFSECNKLYDTKEMYQEAEECLSHQFYLGKGTIITKDDILTTEQKFNHFVFDYSKLEIGVKSGNMDNIQLCMDQFFDQLIYNQYNIEIALTYCIELISMIIRQSDLNKQNLYMKQIIKMQELYTLQQIKDYIYDIARTITLENYKKNKEKQNQLIQRVIELIKVNISNENLSLKWIANEIVYMNVDYLGKLFKKETGENFSGYMNRIRVEKAKRLIENSKNIKVFEVAEKVGYGNNPQYFSQIFKKYANYTPTEYKKLFE